jgi:hypothetical protein
MCFGVTKLKILRILSLMVGKFRQLLSRNFFRPAGRRLSPSGLRGCVFILIGRDSCSSHEWSDLPT